MTRPMQMFRKVLKSIRGARDDDAPPPPPPYRTDWPQMAVPTAQAGANYGLFQHLPLELRRQILGFAFGHRTVHVDLTFDHPLTRKSRPKDKKTGASSARPEPSFSRAHCGLYSELIWDMRQPKQWQWFSCVCHRRAERLDVDKEYHPYPGYSAIEPCEDRCIRVAGPRAATEPGRQAITAALCRCELDASLVDDCFIDVMGWLLACRQAYFDGTDVLYRTNTFHISSPALLHALPRLLPPHHLARVTSLELLWTFATPKVLNDETMQSVWDLASNMQPSSSSSPQPPGDGTTTTATTPFHELCRTLPDIFPNARRLYIALQAFLPPPASFPSINTLADVERVILGPVEDMFRRMGPGVTKEFSLAIQRGGFQAFLERDVGAPLVNGLWRPLGDGKGEGYWLRPGWDDMDLFGHWYHSFDIWGLGKR